MHPNKYDASGALVNIGNAKPSDDDKNGILYSDPSIVQGFDEKTNRPPSGTIGGATTTTAILTINFYNSKGPIESVKYSSFKNAVKK